MNEHRGKTVAARVPAQLRARHCYVAGASGTGKSTLLMNLILQDITAEEIMSLELGESIVRTGGSKTAHNIKTFPDPPLPDYNPSAAIILNTRQNYATPHCRVAAATGIRVSTAFKHASTVNQYSPATQTVAIEIAASEQ
jgi:hypothetical protein